MSSSAERTQEVTPPSFVILCVGRVGSEHLVSLLDSHPRITCFGELFAPTWGAGAPRATTRVPRYFESEHDDPWVYWGEVSSALGDQLVGFKLSRSSIRGHPRARELVEETTVDIIRLRRANRLAQYVSAVLANDSGVWQSTDGSYSGRAVRIDPERCLKALERIARGEEELDRLCAAHRVFELTYEELADEHRVSEAQEFLGVEPRSLTSPYERLRKVPLPDVIENYDELATALAATPFAADFEPSPEPTTRP